MTILAKARWELFCQGILAGKSATQAYKDAGFAGKGARSSAARLLANADVQARIRELQQQAASATIMSVSERMERLSEIAREDVIGKFGLIRQGNVQAIAELNKMCGDYAPTKTDLTSKGESIKPQQTTLVVANGNLTSALASLVDAGAVKVSQN